MVNGLFCAKLNLNQFVNVLFFVSLQVNNFFIMDSADDDDKEARGAF